ncbi:unnamed protein product, partial [Prorocentrum cordatum]
VCARVSDYVGFHFRDNREACYMILYTIATSFNVLLDFVTTYYTVWEVSKGLGFRTYHGQKVKEITSFTEAASQSARGLSIAGGTPTKLYAKSLFMLAHQTNAPYAAFLKSGGQLADELVEAGGAGEAPVDDPSLQVAPVDGAMPASDAHPDTKRATLEARRGYAMLDHTMVQGLPLLRSGDRGILDLLGGPIAVAVDGLALGAPTPRDEPLDVRYLDKTADAEFARKTFAQRAQMLGGPADSSWQVQGPATTHSVLQTHADVNATPKQRLFGWRQIFGLAPTDPGVEERCFLRELFEIALSEEFYVEALRVAEAGDHGGQLGERRLFLGNRCSNGLAIVSPALEQHVATELQEESAVLKGRRKGLRSEAAGASQSCPRRPGQRRAPEKWSREGTEALNELGGRGEGAPKALQGSRSG